MRGQRNKFCKVKMLYSEFLERTGVKVQNDEFEAIHVVYLASDLDKDTFCKMWCKMNASRVEVAKREAKRQQKENKYRNILDKWYMGWKMRKDFYDNYYVQFIYMKFPSDFGRALSHFDIRIGNAEVLSDVHYKVGRALGYIK